MNTDRIRYLFEYVKWKLGIISTDVFYYNTSWYNPNIEIDSNIDFSLFEPPKVIPVINYKGSVENKTDLPNLSKEGDVYLVQKDLFIKHKDKWELLCCI